MEEGPGEVDGPGLQVDVHQPGDDPGLQGALVPVHDRVLPSIHHLCCGARVLRPGARVLAGQRLHLDIKLEVRLK